MSDIFYSSEDWSYDLNSIAQEEPGFISLIPKFSMIDNIQTNVNYRLLKKRFILRVIFFLKKTIYSSYYFLTFFIFSFFLCLLKK